MTDAGANEAAISVVNLRVSYGEREILHGITFDIRRGETMVILGGSGSGKSTLLRTLVGLERPTSGEVWIGGVNTAKISDREMNAIRKRMGMSFQGSALFGSMTVGENVALPLHEHTDLEDSTIEIMVRIKLGQVGLSAFEDFMPSSQWRNERCVVARLEWTQILFFDEPSAGPDPIIAAGLDELILNLKTAYDNDGGGDHELRSAFRSPIDGVCRPGPYCGAEPRVMSTSTRASALTGSRT